MEYLRFLIFIVRKEIVKITDVKFTNQQPMDDYAQAVRMDDHVEVAGQGGQCRVFNFPDDLRAENI